METVDPALGMAAAAGVLSGAQAATELELLKNANEELIAQLRAAEGSKRHAERMHTERVDQKDARIAVLETTNAQLERKLTELQEREAEQTAAQLARLRTLEKNLVDKCKEAEQSHVTQARERKKLRFKCKKLEDRVVELQRQVASGVEQYDKLRVESNRIVAESNQRLAARTTYQEDEVQKLTDALEAVTEEQARDSALLDRARNELARIGAEYEPLKQKFESTHQALEHAMEAKDQIAAEKEQLAQACAETEDDLKQIRASLEMMEKDRDALADQVARLTEQARLAHQRGEEQQRTVSDLDNALEKIKTELGAQREENAEWRGKWEACNTALQQASDDLAAAQEAHSADKMEQLAKIASLTEKLEHQSAEHTATLRTRDEAETTRVQNMIEEHNSTLKALEEELRAQLAERERQLADAQRAAEHDGAVAGTEAEQQRLRIDGLQARLDEEHEKAKRELAHCHERYAEQLRSMETANNAEVSAAKEAAREALDEQEARLRQDMEQLRAQCDGELEACRADALKNTTLAREKLTNEFTTQITLLQEELTTVRSESDAELKQQRLELEHEYDARIEELRKQLGQVVAQSQRDVEALRRDMQQDADTRVALLEVQLADVSAQAEADVAKAEETARKECDERVAIMQHKLDEVTAQAEANMSRQRRDLEADYEARAAVLQNMATEARESATRELAEQHRSNVEACELRMTALQREVLEQQGVIKQQEKDMHDLSLTAASERVSAVEQATSKLRQELQATWAEEREAGERRWEAEREEIKSHHAEQTKLANLTHQQALLEMERAKEHAVDQAREQTREVYEEGMARIRTELEAVQKAAQDGAAEWHEKKHQLERMCEELKDALTKKTQSCLEKEQELEELTNKYRALAGEMNRQGNQSSLSTPAAIATPTPPAASLSAASIDGISSAGMDVATHADHRGDSGMNTTSRTGARVNGATTNSNSSSTISVGGNDGRGAHAVVSVRQPVAAVPGTAIAATGLAYSGRPVSSAASSVIALQPKRDQLLSERRKLHQALFAQLKRKHGEAAAVALMRSVLANERHQQRSRARTHDPALPAPPITAALGAQNASVMQTPSSVFTARTSGTPAASSSSLPLAPMTANSTLSTIVADSSNLSPHGRQAVENELQSMLRAAGSMASDATDQLPTAPQQHADDGTDPASGSNTHSLQEPAAATTSSTRRTPRRMRQPRDPAFTAATVSSAARNEARETSHPRHAATEDEHKGVGTEAAEDESRHSPNRGRHHDQQFHGHHHRHHHRLHQDRRPHRHTHGGSASHSHANAAASSSSRTRTHAHSRREPAAAGVTAAAFGSRAANDASPQEEKEAANSPGHTNGRASHLRTAANSAAAGAPPLDELESSFDSLISGGGGTEFVSALGTPLAHTLEQDAVPHHGQPPPPPQPVRAQQPADPQVSNSASFRAQLDQLRSSE